MSVRVRGKGRRERVLPLWKPAAAALRAWLAIREKTSTPEVFVNARGQPMSRWGFAYILKQHVKTAHPLARHSELSTTEIYTRGDPSEKLEAIEAVVPPHLRKGAFPTA